MILPDIFIICRAIFFSGLSSLAKSGRWTVLSFEGAWQNPHFTPSDSLKLSITLSRSSMLISFGSTFRFLKWRSSGGLVAAMPASIKTLTKIPAINFLLKCIHLILKQVNKNTRNGVRFCIILQTTSWKNRQPSDLFLLRY